MELKLRKSSPNGMEERERGWMKTRGYYDYLGEVQDRNKWPTDCPKEIEELGVIYGHFFYRIPTEDGMQERETFRCLWPFPVVPWLLLLSSSASLPPLLLLLGEWPWKMLLLNFIWEQDLWPPESRKIWGTISRDESDLAASFFYGHLESSSVNGQWKSNLKDFYCCPPSSGASS